MWLREEGMSGLSRIQDYIKVFSFLSTLKQFPLKMIGGGRGNITTTYTVF